MKILDKAKPESTDSSRSAADSHEQDDDFFVSAPEFKPLGKSPKKALLLSLLPGTGHIYVGQTLSGLVFLVSAALSLFIVGAACLGVAALNGLQGMAQSLHLTYNNDFGDLLGAVSLSHPAVVSFAVLYLVFVAYVAQDAYIFATRGNSPLYPPSRGVRFAPVFGGSYLAHCAFLLLLLGMAFFVASKKPPEQVTVIDLVLDKPVEPPPPEEKPAPEPPKPRLAPKITPKQERPRPVEKVNKPTPQPVVTPPVVPDTPVPVAAVPPAPTSAPADSSPGTGTGDPSASGVGEPSEGGGGGDGEEADFSGYLADMEKRIRKAWFPPRGNENAKIVVAFKLNSAGKVSSVRLKTSSGLMIADTAATDAIKNAGPFGSLPKGAPDKVDIVFTFDYTVFNGGGKALVK